jgi:hypothetical protein
MNRAPVSLSDRAKTLPAGDLRHRPASKLKCGRRVVVGDVMEVFVSDKVRGWSRVAIAPGDDLTAFKSSNFGKTWRWIKAGRMPFDSAVVEVYKGVGGPDSKITLDWYPSHWVSGGVRDGIAYFKVENGSPDYTAADEGPFWRWPLEKTTVEPEPPKPEPEATISRQLHYAKLFTERANAAINAVASFERVGALRLLALRTAHDALNGVIPQFERPLSQQELRCAEVLTFMRNILFASMQATEHLGNENAAMCNAVSRLNDREADFALAK